MRSLALVQVTELPNPSYIGQMRNRILTGLNQHKQNRAILEQTTYHNIKKQQLKILTSNVETL